MSSTTAELEAQLAAVKLERAAKAEARELSQSGARLEAQIAREKKLIEEDETYAKLVEEHGEEAIKRLTTRFGMVVVTSAPPLVHRRMMDKLALSDHANPKVRKSLHDTFEEMVKHCLVYPSKAVFAELADKVPSLISIAANEAYELGKPRVEDEAGK